MRFYQKNWDPGWDSIYIIQITFETFCFYGCPDPIKPINFDSNKFHRRNI